MQAFLIALLHPIQKIGRPQQSEDSDDKKNSTDSAE
jgi:hypothetical protein